MKTGYRKASPLFLGILMRAGLVVLMTATFSVHAGDLNFRAGARAVNTLAQEMLTVHNAIRSEVKVPPLKWSSTLAASAQKWANRLLREKRSGHNPDSPYGENIFIAGIGSTPSMAVKEWDSESQDYEYRTNACSGDCGHYTQIVWRHTLRVGCAVARGARREVWVCSYDPPGNYRGEWPY